VQYVPNDRCKDGWCNSPKWLNIAMGVLMDINKGKSGPEVEKEVGDNLPPAEKTFALTRIITYSPGIR